MGEGVLEKFRCGTVSGTTWRNETVVGKDVQYVPFLSFPVADDIPAEYPFLQVVGHTPVEHIFRSGNIISCDVFSTYRNGEPIGTQEFLVIDTKTWRFHTYRSKDVSR